MPWNWRYEDSDGKPVEGPAEAFSNQADAESWIGQTWRELQGTGVSWSCWSRTTGWNTR